MVSRRSFLRRAAGSAAACALAPLFSPPALAEVRGAPKRSFEVVRIDRFTVKLPYREVPARAMSRELPHWQYVEVFEVELGSGHVGRGETLLYYTWRASGDQDVSRALGRNAAELLWDDSLGAGLQMALFDSVARSLEVPIHRLLGKQVYERTPLSWWNIDMPPEDTAAECREAFRQGYLSYKTKGRPWFDVWAMVEAAARAVPEEFKIDLDFNDTLLDAARAIPILKDLERYPQVDIYETPIPQGDIRGNQEIRAATRVKIAMHYGNPPPAVALKEEVCDGFVVGGGARHVLEQGAVCAMADKPLWLQLVGTGITAAFSLHFGAVLAAARWPAVNCHQLYHHQLLTEPIRVEKGFARVPEGPGLGCEVDRKALERYRIDKPERRPDPPRLIETTWPGGRRMYIASSGQVNFMLSLAARGRMPFYERGVTTRLFPNDGSSRWRELHEKAKAEPLLIDG
jgi:L-alanine-DL-glutamate epimerase-like enolase superfamily enzyme